jgi:prophage tail gpP-like protein
MAQQKDIVLSHTEKGELLFTRAKTDIKPILEFDLTKGTIPGTSFEFDFDGQKMHSHIWVQGQAAKDGGNAKKSFVRNYYVPVVYRPKVTSQSSGDDNDTGLAAKRELAAELKGLKLTIETDRWLVDGTIIKPNNTITIIAPELYIYRKTKFFIEQVEYTGNEKQTTAKLTCVLPEVYNGQVPGKNDTIFAGINLYPKPHI